MRASGFAEPGEFGDHLTSLALRGSKVATARLWNFDDAPDGEELETVGELQAVLDSDGEPCAVIEVTRVERHPFDSVAWELAAAEGEGFADLEPWRAGEFHHQQGIEIDDDEPTEELWLQRCGCRSPAGRDDSNHLPDHRRAPDRSSLSFGGAGRRTG